MKTTFSHIPESKQKELLKVLDIIKKSSKWVLWVEMVILYWSYARGDFVEKDLVQEGYNTLEYKSDFDILVVTKKPNAEKNVRLSREITAQINSEKNILSPVSLIIEDIYHVNNKLEENRYFDLDIKKEWILLYDTWKAKLKDAKVLTKKEKLKIKKEDYEMWFFSAEEFFIDYKNAFDRWSYKIAVFYLHQATERYITAFLLVKSWYKPKSHDLNVLYDNINQIDFSFEDWFSGKNESKYFELLRRAYVDARYSKDYVITKEEILFLEKKVIELKWKVEELCKKELGL